MIVSTQGLSVIGTRPNIMLIECEDVGLHFGCYGSPDARTPNLDKLAAEGARFDKAFSHSPVCSPSRSGMVTGCYPWSIGTHHHSSRLLSPPRTFMHELRDHGYYVSWPTKQHFNFTPVEGWVDDCEMWWKKKAPNQPFMVYNNLNFTHEGTMFPERQPVHRRDVFSDISEEFLHDPEHISVPSYLPDTQELREQIAAYYDALSLLDLHVGQRLAWLAENGLADNTIVIVLSDHGRGLPREKRWCYGAGLHMPLLIRWPGAIESGTIDHELVSWIDIAPSLLAAAQVPIPEHYQGQIAFGPHREVPRRYVFAGRDRMGEVYDHVRCAISKRWHYIRNSHPELPYAQRQNYMERQAITPVLRNMHCTGQLHGRAATFMAPHKPSEELYDSDNDPEMVNNLAESPAHVELLEQHRKALDQLIDTFGDLGQCSEEDLIKNGILEDQLEYFRSHQQSLPLDQQLGLPIAPLTKREAERS